MVFAQLMPTPADGNSLRDNIASKRSLVHGHDDGMKGNLQVWPLPFHFAYFFFLNEKVICLSFVPC